MRRGLMAWDADEIPLGVLRERIERLQSAMVAAGQDALLLYTNFVRSAAVSYLTAFSPYWADGVLLVPSHGEPVFATTLSKRVGSWIQSVKPVGELLTSPTPGTVLGARLAANGIRRLAILELDDFPSGLYSELTAALPGVDLVIGNSGKGSLVEAIKAQYNLPSAQCNSPAIAQRPTLPIIPLDTQHTQHTRHTQHTQHTQHT